MRQTMLAIVAACALMTLPLAAKAGVDQVSVSVAVFDPAIPADPSVYRDLDIFPRIREVEAMLWPFQLRESLIATGSFTTVRVVPEPEPNAELSVVATILHSDGFALRLHIAATDALGRVWIDAAYEAAVGEGASADVEFQPVFDAIAADLASAAARLDADDVDGLAEVSVLRYAASIAPRAFGNYLAENDDGTLAIRRLPARDDPMIERVRMVRETEFVVSDVIDEAFVELYADIRKVHDLWREYQRQNALYQQENARRARENNDDADRASYEHLQHLYDVYKWDRMTDQEQDRLAVAFNNEVGPRVSALETRIAELQVWIDGKNAEWNRLLEALFEVERRPEPAARGAP